MRARAILSAIAIAALLSGCTCQRQMQRLQRRCPECFGTIQTTADTTIVLQHLPEWFHFSMPTGADTIVLHGTHTTLSICIDTNGSDSVQAQVECNPDTVYISIPVTVDAPVSAAKDNSMKCTVILLLSTFFVFCSVHLIYSRRR